ncbi:porin [Rhodovibrionaceae bacterium A322]
MKKFLLSSSVLALAAALPAAASAEDGKIQLEVGGWYQSVVSFVSQDNDNAGLNANGQMNDYNPVNVRQAGRIEFSGRTVLENGVRVGFYTDMRAVTVPDDQIAQTYVWTEGNFGRVEAGSASAAANTMSYAAPSAGLGLNSPDFVLFQVNDTLAPTGGFLNFTDDANKITYFTPRMSGFQLGASFTPNTDNTDGDRQTFGLNNSKDVGAYKNAASFGANFVESFDSVDVSVSGGYEWAKLEANDASTGNNLEDYKAYSVGTEIAFSGFTLGGMYSQNNAGADNSDVTWWDLGATYGTGPWTVGVTYVDVSAENGAGVKDKRRMGELGATYALSPGIDLIGSLQYFKEENQGSGLADVKGYAGALSASLSF